MTRKFIGVAVAAAISTLAIAVAPVRGTNAQSAADGNGGGDVATRTVCFEVHNGPDQTRVIGTRFQASNSDLGKVIVLVHGFGATRRFWDVRPDYSVARNLARAGYLVFSYDELTDGDSTYHGSYATTGLTGNAVTVDSAREQLFEVVEQIRGTYPFSATRPLSCPVDEPLRVSPNPKVILIGHSAGGGLVKGYAGEFGKVAPVDAVVQAEDSDQGSSDEITHLYVEKTTAPADIAVAQWSFFLDDGSTRASKSISPATCAENIRLLLYAGISTRPDLFAVACDPADGDTVPSVYAQTALLLGGPEQDQWLKRTPAGLPVLLAWADHDGIFPDDPSLSRNRLDPCGPLGCQRGEDKDWARNCPCAAHVTAWTEQNTGHDFTLSSTMPTFTQEVTAWLARNGLAPSAPSGARD